MSFDFLADYKSPEAEAEEAYRLGTMYMEGDGVARNRAKAIEYWTKAAPHNANARFKLLLASRPETREFPFQTIFPHPKKKRDLSRGAEAGRFLARRARGRPKNLRAL